MKCLVTGFEAFEGVEENPTELIVRRLPERIDGVTLEREVLAVEYGVVDRQLTDNRLRDLSAIFMLGAAGEARFGRLERVAYNLVDSPVPDNQGRIQLNEPIDTTRRVNAPLPSTVSFDTLSEKSSASTMPWRLSDDPGRYVCNDSYFRVLSRLEKGPHQIPAIFVHIPVPGRPESIWSLDQIYESAEVLLTQFLRVSLLDNAGSHAC